MNGLPEHASGSHTNFHQHVERIKEARATALRKAWDSLGRYKFFMFGYHAAAWVQHNRLLDKPEQHGNPFVDLVNRARGESPYKVPK